MTKIRKLSYDQDVAANPSENIWVQANAGTGKTSVLIQRLLRILFRGDDFDKNGILCLTYTNAAAAEMRNRILAALRQWANASDDDLRDLLYGVAVNNPATEDDIARAREIFFQYIDNPDVLKIKTIHGFCQEILQRFPIEAGIKPGWTLVSDANQRVLLQDAFDMLINSATTDERTIAAFSHIVGRVSETYVDDLLNELGGQYKYFFDIINTDNYRQYFIDTTRQILNLSQQKNTDFDIKTLQKIIDLTDECIKSSKKPAKFLFDIVEYTKQYIDNTIDFEKYKTVYLKQDGGRVAAVAKYDFLTAEQERVHDIDQYNINHQIFDDTIAMFDLSAQFAKNYMTIKRAHNFLDFEDLILYTRKLFSDPANMGWVLSQMDVQLTHILLDEAQDTSPAQWDILRMLSGDFFVNGDTADKNRSLFVVGDTKQSIYGFQGADPTAFAASRDEIGQQIKNNLRTIREVPLSQSFRSLPAILRTVDKLFSDADLVRMTGFHNNAHTCFRTGIGVVEINKLISKQSDGVSLKQYVAVIADKIEQLITSGEYTASDIMVLVQNRRPMTMPLVHELKSRNIAVSGSDRIVLPMFPAVRDFMNLVRFCLNNADDYALCCVLKSPIYRLTEADIFNICQTKNVVRTKTVFDVLADVRPDIFDDLQQIIKWADTCGPYTFFTNILNHNNVRQSIIAALGDQVIDPLEEFMTICLSYERTNPGIMRHFLKWFITGNSEVKRDMDAAAGVRISTVHASKGLEARVVFLIDTARVPGTDNIVPIVSDNGNNYNVWLWSPRANNSEQFAAIVDKNKFIGIAEYYRLLYVAMTRARDALFVYGYTSYKNAPDTSWHSQMWRVFAGDTDTTKVKITDE